MNLKKTLLPAVIVAGVVTASLSGCYSETKEPTSTGPSAATSTPTTDGVDTIDFFDEVPKEVPMLPQGDVSAAETTGSDVTGDFTVKVTTKGSTAKADAAKVLTDEGYTSAGTDVYENSKWKVTLSGSGSAVEYKLDRK